MNATWTEERVARLTELWNEGMAARLIAVDIGLTKNAIIGKAHRLELPDRPSPILHCARTFRTPRSSPGPAPKRLEHLSGGHMPTGRSVVHTAKMASGARFRECQFFAEEPGPDSCKCGKPTIAGTAYCETHYRLCHIRSTVE